MSAPNFTSLFNLAMQVLQARLEGRPIDEYQQGAGEAGYQRILYMPLDQLRGLIDWLEKKKNEEAAGGSAGLTTYVAFGAEQ